MLDLSDCSFIGPAFPAPFVRFELAAQLEKRGLLHEVRDWNGFRQQLRSSGGGPQRVCNHVVVPLASRLGFGQPVRQDEVITREGAEDGGWLIRAAGGAKLRAWTFAAGTDLDAPHRSGRAHRFGPERSAFRVLFTSEERLGLLTDGQELRLLLCDPALPGSSVAIPLAAGGGWRNRELAPDSFRLVLALASPRGLSVLPELLEAARLSQSRLTKELRTQARSAIEGFLQAVIDRIGTYHHLCADTLWREGLTLVYRLLFILKLESATEPGRGFSFASTSLWRASLSPNRALGPLARRLLDHGHDTGRMLEDGLRLVFRVFRDGLSTSELSIAPLGGALFGTETTSQLDRLAWGERACALLLDRLLWTRPKGRERERVHYGSLDVEDLGHIYEALLELEPGIAREPMCRVRRAKLEVVVPERRGARYRVSSGTRAMWAEDIPAGRFYLRAGSARKASGSYYTPHPFVRFLVQGTLAPKLAQCSSEIEPRPEAILALKVLDPAAGSGHFLVEACRYLGDALYAACRRCDELATAAGAEGQFARAEALRERVAALPAPNGMLLAYLPGRSSGGHASGVSQARAMAICRRLVAVHCLYGVDTNQHAIELAKLSLWLESYAEGLPLTFLDHRLVYGDSIAGPVAGLFATMPTSRQPLEAGLISDLRLHVDTAMHAARREVRVLEASVGIDAVDVALKSAARQRLDAVLQPLRFLAQAWSGAAMCAADEAWLVLARGVAAAGKSPVSLDDLQVQIVNAGGRSLPWKLTFPDASRGFDAVIGNPPWDIVQPNKSDFLAAFDPTMLDTDGNAAARRIADRLLAEPAVAWAWRAHKETFTRQHRIVDRLYAHQRIGAHGGMTGGKLDMYRVFAERMVELAAPDGAIGMIVPSAFHANEGASGVRQLYLRDTSLETCLSFENREKHFDIDSRFKFALVIARRPGPTATTQCGFYLSDLALITDTARLVTYDRSFLAASGGVHSTFLELRHRDDMELARRMFCKHEQFRVWSEAARITLSRELHMTDDARSFALMADLLPDALRDYLPLHEGKTIHQFTDRRDTRPRYAVAASRLAHKPRTVEASRHFRAACREVAGATNERTGIAAMLPPGVLCGHTISVERTPALRPNASALVLVTVMNSYSFDWLLRQKAAAHVSIYILADLPMPDLSPDAERFLAHGCLRLCCNHRGFARLWAEQLGDTWRESATRRSWPVIIGEAARWGLRAALDAVVASGYGLHRAQFERILASFKHKTWPAAPTLCLAAFDELASMGLQRFCRAHDPYADIPLITTNACPVNDLAASPRLPVRSTAGV